MLRKQLVPVQFGALDEKTESKQLSPGGMTRVVNAERNKSGRYDKRTGFGDAHSNSYIAPTSTGTAANIKSVATAGKTLLASDFDADDGDIGFYSRSGNLDKLVYSGDFQPCSVVTKTLSADSDADVISVSSAADSNYTLIAYATLLDSGYRASTDDQYRIQAVVIDNATEQVIARWVGTPVSDALPSPQVVITTDSKYYVFFRNTASTIRALEWDGSNSTFESSTDVVTDANNTYEEFIVQSWVSGKLLLAYCDSSTQAKLVQLSTSLTPTTEYSPSGRAPRGLVQDQSNNVYFFYDDSSGTGLEYGIVNTSGTVLATAQTLDTATTGNVSGVAVSSSSVRLWWNQVNSGVTNIVSALVTTSGGTPIDATLLYNMYLYSECFSCGGLNYFVALHISDTQPTYFVFHADTSTVGTIPVAKLLPKQGPSESQPMGARDSEIIIPVRATVGVIDSNTFVIPMARAIGLNTDGTDTITRPGTAYTKLQFKTINHLPHVDLGNSALIGGGFLALYDGEVITENGFHLYPEISLSASTASGAAMEDGTYQVKAIWEWADAQGRIHRSEPSVAVSITLSSGGSNQLILCEAKILSATSKYDANQFREPRLVAYRTTNGGTTFYRVSDPFAAVLTNTIRVNLAIDDTDLVNNEILYTNGGEVANEQPPACGHLAIYKNRVWATDLEDQSATWYSKLRVNNTEPYAFSEALQITVGDSEGVRASQALDDKLVFLKERQLLYTYGEGPDNTGQNGAFAEPVDVNFDGGIAEPVSLVKFPQGIAFKHQRGFYAMGADLNPVYIGKNVEDFNDLTVTSAVLIPSKNQIRWTHSDGSILAYDYFHQQWYEYSDVQCSGGTVRAGKHVIVSSNTIYEQDDTVWTDGGSSYNFLVQTGWISFAGLSGFKRVYKIFFEAVYKADHDLTVTVDMEQDGTVYTDTYTVDAATVSGGTDTYRWEIALSRQKCSSIRVKIEDTSLAGTEQSLNIINMSMLVGLKAGGAKYASAKQIG